MWEMGFWLHWQLWGTEVSQSRKWLDLPCGRLAHPDNNPHSFEHPVGRHKRPQTICLSRRQKFGWCCVTAINKKEQITKTFKGIESIKMYLHHSSSKTKPNICVLQRDNWQQSHFLISHWNHMWYKLLYCPTGSWSNSLFAKKYEYPFKQTNDVRGIETVKDCNNRSTSHVVYLFCGFMIYSSHIL